MSCEIEYIDREIAIVRIVDADKISNEEAIKALFGIRQNSRCESKDLREAIEIVEPFFGNDLVFGKSNYSPDCEKIEPLGFSYRCDGNIWTIEGDSTLLSIVHDGGFYHKRLALSIPHLLQLVEALQFLARLHVFAIGDPNAKAISFICDPRKSARDPVIYRVPLPSMLSKFPSANIPIEGAAKVEYEGDSALISFLPFGWPTGVPLSNWTEEQSLKAGRFAAGSLLAALAEHATSNKYKFDWETNRLRRNEHAYIIDYLFDLIADGKVVACPNCGSPAVKLKKGSTPFCRREHGTRYNEKAKLRFKNGMSIEEIKAQFPYIRPETIDNWQR